MNRHLNVNRMRRYSARTTPDEVRTMFDPLSDDYVDKSHRWLDQFRRKMIIKHGEGTRIDVYVDDDYGKFKHQVMILALVVKKPIKTKIYSRQRFDISNLLPLATIGMPIHKAYEDILSGTTKIKALCGDPGYNLAHLWRHVDCPKCLIYQQH